MITYALVSIVMFAAGYGAKKLIGEGGKTS